MCFLPFHGQVSLDNVQATFPWKGGSPTVGRTRLYCLVLPLRRSLPVLGTASPPGNLPEEKRPSPGRGAGKPPRVRKVIPRQVGRKYRQGGVPAVLFPFFREDMHQFPPIRVQAVSPVRRKPRDPWGSGWPRLGPSMGESGPWANPMKNLRSASQVINLDLEIHVGQNNDVRKGWCACSGSTPRMREVERKKQKGESNHGLRICRQWFRQLGHGLIVSYLRSNQTRYFCCYSATSPWALHRFFELHFQKYICG